MKQVLNIQPNNLVNSLVTDLESYQEEKGITWSEVARRTNLSSSIISQWRKGNYAGDNEEVNTTIERFLRIEKSKSGIIFKNLKFVEIGNSKKIINGLKAAHRDGIIAAIVGNSGTGKSTAIDKYENENDVIKISANRSFKFPIEYLRRIHTHPKVGKDGRGTMNKLFQDIVNELKDKNILLIVDQSDYLNLSAIDIFRSLNDEAGVGITFVGLPSFLGTVRGNQPEVKQVRDRIRLRLELKEFKSSDCDKILDENWPELNGIKKIFYAYSNGSLRTLSSLIYHAKILLNAPGNDKVIPNEDLIKRAASYLETTTIG